MQISRVFSLKSFTLTFAGMTLDFGLPLISQVPDGATLTVKRKKFFIHDIPAQASPEVLLALCEEHENLLPEIMEMDTELGEKLSSKDVKAVRMLMMQRSFKGHKAAWEKKKEEEAIFANPDTAENQAKIAEMLRVQEVNRLHDIAMEENPESFAQVYMLYVNLEVNNVPLKAFVDSGAQMTIMSEACAERCNVLRFLDKRYAGMASGVGTAKILGKIHMVQMKLGNSYFPVSATILENSSMDVLFGLDTLKRYRCCIDLHKNVLRMGDGVTGAEEVPFLSEAEIPQSREKTEEGNGLLGGKGGGSGDKALDALLLLLLLLLTPYPLLLWLWTSLHQLPGLKMIKSRPWWGWDLVRPRLVRHYRHVVEMLMLLLPCYLPQNEII